MDRDSAEQAARWLYHEASTYDALMANNYAGELIHAARIDRSMTFGDLARACGATTAKQTSRIAQRLVLFEREGVRDRNLLQKVIAALDLDSVTIVGLLHRQHIEELEAWNRWADEKAALELHIRPFAGVWIKLPLPVEMAADEWRAIEYAKQITIGRKDMRVVLAVSRRVAYTFTRGQLVDRLEAAPERSIVPVVKIGDQLVQFEASE